MERLKSLKSWTYCTGKNNKAPARGLGGSQPMSYEQAVKEAKNGTGGSPYYGYVFGNTSEYIGIDVDVDPSGKKQNATKEIPGELLFFLIANPTHVHYSPNTFGLHIIYRLTKETQETLNGLNLNQKAASIKKGDLFDGDWRYRKSFLTVTDSSHPSSRDKIAYIGYDALCELIPSIQGNAPTRIEPIIPASTYTEQTSRSLPKEPVQVPSIKQLAEVFKSIPCTYNAKAQRACESLNYAKPNSNYDYWVLVGNACAHYVVCSAACGRHEAAQQVIEIFLKWSQGDEEGFTDDADVISKFQLLIKSTREKVESGTPVATFGTLATIAKNNIIEFPAMRSTGKGKLLPDPGASVNIDALMEHEQLELVFDPMGGGVTMCGPEEAISQWFCPQRDYNATRPKGYGQVCSPLDLAIRLKPFMQKHYAQSVSSGNAREFLDHISQNMRRENAFKSWIDEKPWDGEERFAKVCDSITVAKGTQRYKKDLYKQYIRWSLLSMIGIHYWPQDSPKIPAMLVLMGPEYTYKSSWAEWLIPKHMSNYTATADIGTVLADGKDWQMFLSTKATIVINECEPMFTPKHEQKIKAAVDAESVSFRDPYGKQILSRPRTALIIGTTNKPELFTGSNGTRKIWQIPVTKCDSMLIKNMDLQQLYAEILFQLRAYKVENPKKLIQMFWSLSEDDRVKTNVMNAESKGAALGTMGILAERFGKYTDLEFDIEHFRSPSGNLSFRKGDSADLSNNPNFWTASSLAKFLRIEYPDEKVDRTAIVYILDEYAGYYSKTGKPGIPFAELQGSSRTTTVTKGRYKGPGGLEYYIMPPLLAKEADFNDCEI